MSDTSVELSTLQQAREIIEAKGPIIRSRGTEAYEIAQELSKAAKEKKARQTTVDLADMTIITTEKQAKDKFNEGMKPRVVNSADGKVTGYAAEQLKYKHGDPSGVPIGAETMIHRSIELRNKGYDKLTTLEKKWIAEDTAKQLARHPGFLATWPDFDASNPKHVDTIKEYFKNPRMRDLLMKNLNDGLQGEQPDYTQLQKLLQEQWKINDQLTKLNTDKTTAEADLTAAKAKLGDFKEAVYEVDASGALVAVEAAGRYAKAKEDFDKKIQDKTLEKSQLETALQQVNALVGIPSAKRPWAGAGAGSGVTVQILYSVSPLRRESISSDAELLAFMSGNPYATMQSEITKITAEIEDFKNKKSLIESKKTQIEADIQSKEARLNQVKNDTDETKDGSVAKKKKDKDAEVRAEEDKVKAKEKSYFEGIDNVMSDSVIDLLLETSRDVRDLKGTLHDRATKKAQEAIYELVWDPKKRRIDTKSLKGFVDIIKNSQRRGGASRWAEDIGDRVIAMSTPGSENLLKDYFRTIKNDPELLKQFGQDMFKEVGKFINFKEPRAFDNIFTPDETAMMRLREDVLPDLIKEVKNNKELATAVSQAIGEDITKNDTWFDKFKSKAFNWKTMSTLLVLLALGVAPGVGGWVALGKAGTSWAASTADKWGPALYKFAMSNNLPALQTGIDAASKYVWPAAGGAANKVFLPLISKP